MRNERHWRSNVRSLMPRYAAAIAAPKSLGTGGVESKDIESKYPILGYPSIWLHCFLMQDPDTLALALLIRRERENAKITQAELAAMIGVPQSFISKCETGERRIGVLDLRRICPAIGLSPTEFVDRLEGELTKRSQ